MTKKKVIEQAVCILMTVFIYGFAWLIAKHFNMLVPPADPIRIFAWQVLVVTSLAIGIIQLVRLTLSCARNILDKWAARADMHP